MAITAEFTASVTSGQLPLEVRFTDTSVGSPTLWLWDFGDGSSEDPRQNPDHVYARPGNYDVSLTAASGLTSDTIIKTGFITVAPYVVDFNALIGRGTRPFRVSFLNATTGVIPNSYFWDFGDGATSSERSPIHTYETPGNYTVAMRVRVGI